MFRKNICGEVQSKVENPSVRFLFMFVGVVPGSLLLFATGIREFGVLQQPNLAWSVLAIALFLSFSLARGGWMFGHKSPTPSILAALPFSAPRGK